MTIDSVHPLLSAFDNPTVTAFLHSLDSHSSRSFADNTAHFQFGRSTQTSGTRPPRYTWTDGCGYPNPNQKMIGLDTNILVRYLIQDDPDQARIAESIIQSQCNETSPGWINRIVLCELVSVLEDVYNCPRSEIATTLRQLLETAELEIEDHALAWSATELYSAHSVDFSNALLVATNRDQGCNYTVTFDRKLSRLEDACQPKDDGNGQ